MGDGIEAVGDQRRAQGAWGSVCQSRGSVFSKTEKAAVMALFDRSIASGEAFGYNGEQEQAYCCRVCGVHGRGLGRWRQFRHECACMSRCGR
jgi:hypothetical protein